MKISIIVPAFNEEQFLGKTLAQIKAAASALANTGWGTELIVCDNNSTDRTAEIARSAGANVVFEPVNQISRARNSGAAAATGDWLVFVDADSYPSAGVFADMAKEIQSGNCIAGGATIRWDQKLFIMELLTPLVNLGFRWRRMLSGALIQQRSVWRGRCGIGPAIETSGKNNQKTICHPAPASGRNLRAKNAALHHTPANRTIQTAVLHHLRSTPRDKRPQSRSYLV